jgi:hypothetical protein
MLFVPNTIKYKLFFWRDLPKLVGYPLLLSGKASCKRRAPLLSSRKLTFITILVLTKTNKTDENLQKESVQHVNASLEEC